MSRVRSHLVKGLLTTLVFVIPLGGVLGGSLAWAQNTASDSLEDSLSVEWIEGEGVVQEISLADSTVVISGFEYRVVPHASVQVRGNASSLAGLAEGMQVHFWYETFEGLKAQVSAVAEGSVIHELEQLPDNLELLQH